MPGHFADRAGRPAPPGLGPEQRDLLCGAFEAYLLHGGNCTDTARSLGIPRNTLLYRIGRIQQMISGNLEQVDDRRRLLISPLLL